MSVHKTILIFGSSGNVGNSAAHEARRRGAHVLLGLRDVNKEVAGIPNTAPGFTRVHADLSKPETLTSAVKKSGAKVAFIYCLFTANDGMLPSIKALKEGGIEYVVLLSSFDVDKPARDIPSDQIIGKVHADVEVSLEEVGLPFASVRPGYFNTNVFWQLDGIKKGEVEIWRPEIRRDYISPDDIGVVCGHLTVNPVLPDQGQPSKVIFLTGPKLLTEEEAHGQLAKAIGRDLKVVPGSEESFRKGFEDSPKPVIDYLCKHIREYIDPEADKPELYREGLGNLRKYLEREPTSFAEWAKIHKAEFA